MAPRTSHKENIGDLKIKCASLESKVEVLQKTVLELTSDLQSLHHLHEESIAGHAHFERILESLRHENEQPAQREAETARRLEQLEQYSRKYTLILTGKAVPPHQKDEDIRRVTIRLLYDHLGININRDAITACHRLQAKGSILLRLADLDLRMHIYAKRTKPTRRGLMVFESLTSERLAIIRLLKSMKDEPNCPFHSYFTFRGLIYLKFRENDRPVEIVVGTVRDQILQICKGERLVLGSQGIRGGQNQGSGKSGQGEWQKAQARKKPRRAATPPPMGNRSRPSLSLVRVRSWSDSTSLPNAGGQQPQTTEATSGKPCSSTTKHKQLPDRMFESSLESTSLSGDDTFVTDTAQPCLVCPDTESSAQETVPKQVM